MGVVFPLFGLTRSILDVIWRLRRSTPNGLVPRGSQVRPNFRFLVASKTGLPSCRRLELLSKGFVVYSGTLSGTFSWPVVRPCIEAAALSSVYRHLLVVR